MKKTLIILIMALSLLAFSACGCSHESWTDSESGEKICADCGDLYCDINGHSWFAANCENPKSCENCSLTEGEALGHSWNDADCENAKNCSACKATEGKALGHKWIDATTEKPKTCESCSKTEGGRIITDERFKTANCAELFGTWEGIVNLSGEDFIEGFSKYLKVFPCLYTLNFSNDGIFSVTIAPDDPESFNIAIKKYLKDYLYAEFAAIGLSSSEVDKFILEEYGVTIDEYINEEIKNLNIDDIFASLAMSFTYYAKDGLLYTGIGWNLMEPSEYYIEDDVLNYSMDGEMTEFKKVEE